jgi:hypothetical protein
MASERQIAANCANALRSTGSRTAAGRAKSSRNAYRHGLSLPMAPDSELVESLARAIAAETAGEDQPEAARQDQLEAARALAAAQLELKRIREAKVAATPTRLEQLLDPATLTRLCAIGRYERLAQSLRKAAKEGWTRSVAAPGELTGSDKSAAQARKRRILDGPDARARTCCLPNRTVADPSRSMTKHNARLTEQTQFSNLKEPTAIFRG